MLFRRSKSLVGLDIGSSAVKAIELKPSGQTFKVSAIGVEPVPPDSIVDGAIMDSGAVTEALRRLFSSNKFKARQVVASLSGTSVIVKKITLPTMTRGRARGLDLLGSRAVHPFRHPDVALDMKF